MSQKIVILLTLIIPQLIFCQNYQDEFLKYCESQDTINQLKILKKWELKEPKNPELITSFFNYYFMKSKQVSLTLSSKQSKGDGYVLKDSLDRDSGFLNEIITYNISELNKGLDKIDEGIKLYPNRLDMRFGKIYVLGLVKDWKKFTEEITKTIDQSAKNQNSWKWTNNGSYNGSEKEFLLDIQNYQLQLYNTGDNKLLENMRIIANKVLEYYPNHVESLSNLSITYLITGEYEKGIEPLLRAEKINPEDYIVLGNIAQGYKLKGDKAKAIEYYNKVLLIGDESAKEYAMNQLSELKD